MQLAIAVSAKPNQAQWSLQWNFYDESNRSKLNEKATPRNYSQGRFLLFVNRMHGFTKLTSSDQEGLNQIRYGSEVQSPSFANGVDSLDYDRHVE